jgi:hypothetical protein
MAKKKGGRPTKSQRRPDIDLLWELVAECIDAIFAFSQSSKAERKTDANDRLLAFIQEFEVLARKHLRDWKGKYFAAKSTPFEKLENIMLPVVKKYIEGTINQDSYKKELSNILPSEREDYIKKLIPTKSDLISASRPRPLTKRLIAKAWELPSERSVARVNAGSALFDWGVKRDRTKALNALLGFLQHANTKSLIE